MGKALSGILSGMLIIGLAACDRGTSEVDDSAEGVEAASIAAEVSDAAAVCDAERNRYPSAAGAEAAGRSAGEYGATFCPEYKMDLSWDTDRDGRNDCYAEGSCEADADYTSPRGAG